jgi:curved DNA-binding protein CbpA
MVKERQRTLAKLWHPDKGGSLKAIQRLNGAAQELLATLK